MAGSKIRFSFHSRVLLLVLTMSWLLVGTFMVFQYRREKAFKEQLLDCELQMHNRRILDDISRGVSIDSIIGHIGSPLDNLRISLIDNAGNVIFDNNDSTPFPSGDHNSRPEVIEARKSGIGHSVSRYSVSDNCSYFYSAMRGDDGIVIRSAAPYTHSLQEVLKADSSILWIMIAFAIVLSLASYVASHKISLSIRRLNLFAEKAEKGERIYNDEAFPHDELGSIASHIVRLYIQRDEQHREALRQEKDKIRLKKQLTNNINHELKTPVASILVCLELLRDHPEMLSEEKKRELNDRIFANAQRLNSLLKDVAAITRMDEGEEMIEKAPVDLVELVNDVVAEERLRTSMNITVDMPQLKINGNRQLLESIFRNLIDNAISYSGGSEIVIKADNEGNFTVSDNGCGVPDEHLPHIFERFYRIDKGRSRAAGGTGLGLSIVRNAVGIHGSDISVTNDGGLQFRFRLH
ncbi:cell wall metabolism sensor histidine kinase WalK [Muribaculum gordoncarteri]|jgi:signal transduction histidine kinase|uniref:histidine kinase n=6 Tax=Muribaculum TaxID=1918540 RepID=A0A4P7VR35_9BACT|nr:HAMP domain-containing sensor histidine kinase [Muribaculum gordoncarteri]QCD36796.1 sensor histidine kinase [Muribaculum gordoncarteri]ROT15732.1 sensor histidine kinase [Muribaculaceae bacterium Isolate-102 (HZI)]